MSDGPTLPLRKRMLFDGAIFDTAEHPTMTDRADRVVGVDELPGTLCGDPECMCRYLPRAPDAPIEDYYKNFQAWLPLQPVSTEVALLYGIAADLFRRGWPGIGYEVRRAADDLKMLTRHER